EKNLPVFQPETLKNIDIQKQIQSHQADVMVVVAYGLILPKAVLEMPRLGCINVHGSILPKWRGAAPVQYAILSGDKETGVTIMQMDIGMDTGDILQIIPYTILAHDTSESLMHHLSHLAPPALLDTLEKLDNGQIQAKVQDDSLATYANKINKTDAKINWQQPAKIIDCQIRGYYPWPIAYTEFENQVIKIHQARLLKGQKSSAPPGTILNFLEDEVHIAALDDILAISVWQFPNMKKMSLKDWQNGHQHMLPLGSLLS
ncbi:MAG: Methionyl-tRNA formyltransferase, partial [Pseudomonadota bacterium]|nr:Methionyl-tRNA formyltransferase [Pseudomonadota bacterium]